MNVTIGGPLNYSSTGSQQVRAERSEGAGVNYRRRVDGHEPA